MKRFIGKTIRLVIERDRNKLFFLAHIIKVTEHHIYFRDKFDDLYIFRIKDVLEVKDENV